MRATGRGDGNPVLGRACGRATEQARGSESSGGGCRRVSGAVEGGEFVVFRIGKVRYALPADQVREVTQAVAIQPLPKSGPMVEGVFSHRGRLVPLLDIRQRFGLKRDPLHPSHQFIIADIPARRVAIRCDRIEQLVAISAADIADVHQADPQAEYVAGVARLSDGLILIHDLALFLSADEASELDACVAATEQEANSLP